MEKKIVKAARIAKELGYEHVSSVVKQYKATKYYHVVTIEDILYNNKWIPAIQYTFSSGARCRYGVTKKNIPDKCISRQQLFELLKDN